ncbi:MAG: hypothetical protein LBU34_02085 [Planctomycetaceae bacterium]|jgi:hypothetical protein|nr:hypothetical protein [Planctomycetaceae bacterium]
MRQILIFLTLCTIFCISVSFGDSPSDLPPGIIIAKSPDFQKVYIGSPTIVKLSDGTYVASNDWFGSGIANDTNAIPAVTTVYSSKDQGKTWSKLCDIKGQGWSNLFVNKNDLYLFGITHGNGPLVIRRSCDGGKTWTEPKDSQTGLLLEGHYHTAGCGILFHQGKIFRAFEMTRTPNTWGNYEAMVGSVSVDADLLDATQWTFTNPVPYDKKWGGVTFIEGNILLSPEGELVNLLRNESQSGTLGALLHCSDDGKQLSVRPDDVVIKNFIGGNTRFMIRYDQKSQYYWTLACKTTDPVAFRNCLVLVRSKNLRDWEQRCIVLRHRNASNHAWQYVDWFFEGENDIAFISRTAWDGSHNAHDANYLTFHRIENFRELTEKDDALWFSNQTKFETAAFSILGENFSIREFKNDTVAFGNRNYVWKDIPVQYQSSKETPVFFTQTFGGENPAIDVTAKKDAELLLLTLSKVELSGDWKLVQKDVLYYTDGEKTKMSIYSKPMKTGEKLTVPQSQWTGCILILKEK